MSETATERTTGRPLVHSEGFEADLAFRDDPDAAKADQVDGAIGELSPFHETHGYYAQGVEISTAVLPSGWQDRLEPFERKDSWATPDASNRTTSSSPSSSRGARRTCRSRRRSSLTTWSTQQSSGTLLRPSTAPAR